MYERVWRTEFSPKCLQPARKLLFYSVMSTLHVIWHTSYVIVPTQICFWIKLMFNVLFSCLSIFQVVCMVKNGIKWRRWQAQPRQLVSCTARRDLKASRRVKIQVTRRLFQPKASNCYSQCTHRLYLKARPHPTRSYISMQSTAIGRWCWIGREHRRLSNRRQRSFGTRRTSGLGHTENLNLRGCIRCRSSESSLAITHH